MKFLRLAALLVSFLAPSMVGAVTNVIGPGGTLVAWGNLVLPYVEPGTHFTQIATGGNHTLAVKSDGTLIGAGLNTSNESYPLFDSATNIVAVAAGDGNSTILRADGTVFSWGTVFASSPWAHSTARAPTGLSNVVSISARGGIVWAATKDGSVTYWVWGSAITNSAHDVVKVAAVSGEIGSVDALALKSDRTVMSLSDANSQAVSGLDQVVEIAAGSSSNNLALKADGTVFTWGGSSTAPAIRVGLSNVIAIAAGAAHSLALRSDGTVVAWGDNSHGQLAVPEGLSNVVKIAADGFQSIALRSDDTFVAWGYNTFLLAPNGLTDVVMAAPNVVLRTDGTLLGGEGNDLINITGLTNIVAIPKSGSPMALRADGTVVSWGNEPVGLTQGIAIEAEQTMPGSRYNPHIFVLQDDGDVEQATGPAFPTSSLFATNAMAIAAAGLHGLLLKNDGTVSAWGLSKEDYNIMTGFYDKTSASVPDGLSDVSAIAVGAKFYSSDYGSVQHYFGSSLALKRDGTVIEWLDGGTSLVTADAIAIAEGGSHWLALKRDGTVFASPTTYPTSYTMVPKGLTNVIAINASDGQSFAIVATPPSIQKQPSSQQIEIGQTAVFSPQVKGTSPFAYQWFLNGEPIGGETNLTLTITNAQSAAAGSYTVQVTGRGGSASSAPAILSLSNTLMARRTTSGIELTVGTSLGKSYTFESAPAVQGPWSALGNTLPGTDGPLQITNSIVLENERQFYRVRSE